MVSLKSEASQTEIKYIMIVEVVLGFNCHEDDLHLA
jgi:hypothetical protein